MNAAFLLLSAWTASGHGDICYTCPQTTCQTTICSECSECCEREGFLRRLRNRLRHWGRCNDDCCQVSCDHPGPIAGTEHPTCKQKFLDRFCPNRCCPKNKICTYCPRPCAPCQPACESWGSPPERKCWTPLFHKKHCDTCNSCETCSPCATCEQPCKRRGLLNRLFGERWSHCKRCDDCCDAIVHYTPGTSSPEKLKMPKAESSLPPSTTPQKMPTGMNHIERIEIVPKVMPASSYSPRTLEISPGEN